MNDYGTLEIVWFGVIAATWIGYLFLEGFDFGVGMLLRAVGRDQVERRALIHTIGPVWDGNEVWLIVAGGATFAAFPDWYATLLSGFYVPLVLIVLALVVRPVALEFWGKEDQPRWRAAWEWALLAGSVVPAFLWGVVLADMAHGVPIGRDMEPTGSLADLFSPYALLGGATTLALCAAHGALFLSVRTHGELLERSRRAARLLTPVAAATTVAFVAWTLAGDGGPGAFTLAAGAAAGAAALAAPVLAGRRPGWAFAANGLAIALALVTLFADLYPNLLVSSTDPAFNVTLGNAASGSYALQVITVIAALMVPVIVACQAWAYWVFRRRVGRAEFESAAG